MDGNNFKCTLLLEAITESRAQEIIDTVERLTNLRNDFYDDDEPNYDDDPNYDEFYERYENEVGTLPEKLRFPALSVPEDDVVLVSIGSYDREDYWGCSTSNFLVERKSADDLEKVGVAALEEFNEYIDFYDSVISDVDFVRLKMCAYALEHGVVVYREFCIRYNYQGTDEKKNLYESFVSGN